MKDRNSTKSVNKTLRSRRPRHNGAPVANSRNGKIHKIIVMGGSAGAISSLCTVAAGLPADLAAPVLAVIHMYEGGSHLAEVVQRCAPLKTVVPEKAEPLAPGHIYLPSPNHHLVVKQGCVGIVMGPRESRHRPSVNTLFRCAARAYRRNVIGVILSGALDDGAAGVMAIKARGGQVIIEDPATAEVSDMPANAARAVQADYCVPAEEIPAVLTRLVGEGSSLKVRPGSRTLGECALTMDLVQRVIEPQGLTCPDCGGMVATLGKGKDAQFRCHVGHTFSLESLSEGHADALERALWVAMRRLNEQHLIQSNLAEVQTDAHMKKRFIENAVAAKEDMEKLHEILARL
jgi:two-component system chemotaxis response regulator CheB